MEEIAEPRLELLKNLAIHAAVVRIAMGLDLSNTARLLKIDQSHIESIERGEDNNLPIEIMLGFARGLGLTEIGTPRRKHRGAL